MLGIIHGNHHVAAIGGGAWDKRTLERQIDSFSWTHGDVGQMDGYVQMSDDLVATEGDNPTLGLILCTEKNETVVRYSVLENSSEKDFNPGPNWFVNRSSGSGNRD